MKLWIPADRFLSVVERYGPLYAGRQSTIGRAMNRLRSGEQQFVSLEYADKVLIRLGLEHYWHIAKEDGGLADIYEDGAQYGAPPRARNTPPRPARKYATHEERLAAQRKRYRLRRAA